MKLIPGGKMISMRATSFLFSLFLILNGIVLAQKEDPGKIINNVKSEFNKIKDYEVDVHIKVDISFLKMPETEAKVYFKQPDKIHIESNKFALLPKEGLNFSPLSFLNEKYTALYEGEDTIDGIPVSVIKIIPIGNNNNVILTTFWIDQKRNLIMKIESSRKPMGTYQLDFAYNKYSNEYYLPTSMTFTFTIDRTRFPKGMDGQLESGDEDDSKKSQSLTGKVYLTYSNYKINQNLPDSLFDKGDKKETEK